MCSYRRYVVVTEGVILPRSLPVSATELSRWLGLDTTIWLERLVEVGELPASLDRKGLSFDPRCLQDWILRATPSSNGSAHVDLTTLSEVSQSLANGAPLDIVFRSILERVLDVLEAPSGAIFVSDEDAWLDLVAAKGFPGDPLPEALQGAAIWVAANGEPLLLPDPRRMNGEINLADSDQPHDALAVPFKVEGRVNGVLVAMRYRDAPQFTDSHLSIATVLATEFALALERTRVEDAMGRRLTIAQDQLEAYAVDIRTAFVAEKQRTAELRRTMHQLECTSLATVKGMAAAVEAKDEGTAGHLARVTRYGLKMLELMDLGEGDDPQKYEYGFLLHDVGKLGIPDAILSKAGPLTREEWVLMRRHPQIGVRILEGIPFLDGARDIVRSHHERWDGAGYPDGLTAEEIPVGARLFAVADAFDAMTTQRPYRNAMTVDNAILELNMKAGTQFWPEAVDALLSLSSKTLRAMAVADHNNHRV
jgi:HD-GYP domain-containing protein (c-di-GMP phosphodiesterase class II)